MMLPRTAALLCVLVPAAGSRAAEPVAVLPSATDARISAFNAPHLVWLPEGRARDQLLVFLPGTGATPEKGRFHPFAAAAAGLGYHVVALMYPDNLAAQKKCAESADPDAYLKFRSAIIHGGTLGPHRKILPYDSIESRLEKLLVYLDAQQPGRGWSQFLQPGGGVRWQSVVVAGQSQGGGHSYLLGKIHTVARVLMFGSPKDYSSHFHAPAKGFDAQTQTPLRRFFAYNHMRDNGNGCTHDQQRQILGRIGLLDLGVADVDHRQPPYGHAHVLYTDADPVPPGKFHPAVLSAQVRGNQAVWAYLLTEPAE